VTDEVERRPSPGSWVASNYALFQSSDCEAWRDTASIRERSTRTICLQMVQTLPRPAFATVRQWATA
jgi:hypothetical protein